MLSPLQRAAQTAALAMPHLKDLVPWIGHPWSRRLRGSTWPDRRRDRSEIQDDFPWVEWGRLDSEKDEFFDPDERESARSVSDRGYDFMRWCELDPESEIIVATHSAWLLRC